MRSAPDLLIEVGFDLICPWCLIGKRHLDNAIGMLRTQRPDTAIEVRWHSIPLLPGIPKQGLPFAQFYEQRLGSAAAVARRQAQVRESARAAGVDIAFERIQVFPNSLDAHRLVAQAQSQGGAARAAAVIDGLFERYFVRGEDIGAASVLAQVRAEHEIVVDDAGEAALPQANAVHGVPYFLLNRTIAVEGAQPAPVLLDAMLRAISLPSAST